MLEIMRREMFTLLSGETSTMEIENDTAETQN